MSLEISILFVFNISFCSHVLKLFVKDVLAFREDVLF